MQRPFFVYGTLLPDQPNFTLWGSDIVAMEPGTLAGAHLHDMGHYPMMVTAVNQAVKGMIITVKSDAYTSVLQRLDNLEGYDPSKPEQCAYQRKIVDVMLADGRSQTAWTYFGQHQFVKGKPIVPGGNWHGYTQERQIELDDWWQTVSSVGGLHKTDK